MQVHERLSHEQMKRDDSVYIRRSTQNHRTSGQKNYNDTILNITRLLACEQQIAICAVLLLGIYLIVSGFTFVVAAIFQTVGCTRE